MLLVPTVFRLIVSVLDDLPYIGILIGVLSMFGTVT